ncbi:MAG: aminoglycoside adenylyltransferase domain-containing protein [Thermomicrobiales bacterium]
MPTHYDHTDSRPQPTPFPDVNTVLCEFLTNMQTILEEHFLGMYLSGSLALGDFASDRSDIDFVVVTDTALSDDLVSALRAMHNRFNASDSPWATEVEAAYIPRDALRRHNPADVRHPHIERGAEQTLEWDDLDSGWVVQRAILREHGVVVAGPDPHTLIDPVSPNILRRAVVELMTNWWGTMRDDPTPLLRHHIGYQAYAVLTMCRILYTLEFGAIVSKPVAARWAREIEGALWAPLIDRALVWRKGRRDVPPDGDVNATLDMIQFTLERCRQ